VARGKAQFKGGVKLPPNAFLPKERLEIRGLYLEEFPDQGTPDEEELAFAKECGCKPKATADSFVEAIISTALTGDQYCYDEKKTSCRRRADLIMERQWFTRSLRTLARYLRGEKPLSQKRCHAKCVSIAEKLRKITPMLDNMLGVDAVPLDIADDLSMTPLPPGLADKLEFLANRFERFGQVIDAGARLPREDEIDAHYINELTIRLCRIMKDYRIKVTASGDASGDGCGIDNKILEVVFKTLALPYRPLTIRNRIGALKRGGLI